MTINTVRPEGNVQPRFILENRSDSTDPVLFTVDCSEYTDMTAPIPQLEEKLKEVFQQHGAVLLRNTNLKNLQDMARWARVIIKDEVDYKGGSNSRGKIVENVYDTGAPKEAWLHYHHEMAYLQYSIKHLAFCCSASVEGKGYTYISDNDKVTEQLLKTQLGKKLKDKQVCYVRFMTDKRAYTNTDEKQVYNHWQTSFGVETTEEAEKLAEEAGYKWEWIQDPVRGEVMKTTLVISAFEYCPRTDKNVLYSAVADTHMWFDTWPGIMELPKEQRALHMTFGDGEEFTQQELEEWVRLYDEQGIAIKWKTGDIVIIDNYKFAHGRPPYSLEKGEERTLGVILGDTYQRVQTLEDKW